MSQIKKSLVTFSSIHRTKSSNSTAKFSVDLGSAVETQNVLSVQIKNVNFVNAHYNVNSFNNQFLINDGAFKSVTLTEGQYTLNELLNALENALSSVGITIDLAIDSPTKRVKVVSCSPACDFFEINGSQVNTLGRALGIVGSSGFVTSFLFTDLPDISGLYQVNIHSRTLVNGSSIEVVSEFDGSNFTRQAIMGDAIKTIPVNVPFGFQMIYENYDFSDKIEYELERNLKYIDIELRDTENRTIDLHGTHVAITLLVEHLG